MKNKLIIRSDAEGLGKYYLIKGWEAAREKDFIQASIFFKEGFDLVPCDCGNGWDPDLKFDYKLDVYNFISLNDEEASNDYYFVIAYILSHEDFEKNPEFFESGLRFIDKYLLQNECKYGLFVKGRLLFNMKAYEEALKCFTAAQHIGNLRCVSFQLGRLKETMPNKYGLDDLLEVFVDNPSSLCCAYHLSFEWSKRRYAFELPTPPSVHPPKSSLRIHDLKDLFFVQEYTKILETEPLLNYDSLLKSENFTVSNFFKFIESEREGIRKGEAYIIKVRERRREAKREEAREKRRNAKLDYIDPYPRQIRTLGYDGLDVDQYPPEFWDNL